MRRWLCVLLGWLACLPAAQAQPRSSFEDLSPALQAMQRDDGQNPGLLWVAQGRQLFAARCAGCHAAERLREVATRYPAWDRASGRALTLAQKISHRQDIALDDDERLALESFLGWQARGLPVQAPRDARLQPLLEQGRRWFHRPLGQLAMSCAMCHDRSAGRRLAGSLIPQGHPNGYPIYRLEWQAVGSLERRIRGCLSGVRAEPFTADDPALLALELYLKQRAAGLPIETPGVRP